MRDLFFSSGTGHSMMILAFVIGFGLLLGRIRYKNFSLGPVWILLLGILFSALGARADSLFLHFLKEFGLVLYVFAVGLQVGPSFFHSFRKESLKLTLLSVMMILLCVVCVIVLYYTTEADLPSLVGSMTGALTNTPGMGTAQQTYYDVMHGTFLAEVDDPQTGARIAGAFAVAYPFGLLGILLVLCFVRKVFRIDLHAEQVRMDEGEDAEKQVVTRTFVVVNPAVAGLKLSTLTARFPGEYAATQVVRDGTALPAADNPELQAGDLVSVELCRKDIRLATVIFGELIPEDPARHPVLAGQLTHHRLMVTNRQLNGQKLGDLDILDKFGVSVTSIVRSGVTLVARDKLYLQVGDALKVIGNVDDVNRLADLVGNSNQDLERPNLIPIFLGIGVALIAAAVPLDFPALPHAVHLGIAGGTMIVAILLGYFGPRWRITTYTTASANRMIREIGLSLLLATMGLGAGEYFPDFFAEYGAMWILFALLIAIVPALITALVARLALHLNFYQICGLICGSTTNSPALEFTRQTYGGEHIAESFAAVAPLALLLQVLAAQLLILFA